MSSLNPDPEAQPRFSDQQPNNPVAPVPTVDSSAQMDEEQRRSAIGTLLVLVAVAAVVMYFGYGRSAIAFLLTLGVLVFVHEWGHYQFARWGGMKVNRFGIGFPPWIYSRRYKGIDYSIGALPIGGMVDIAGLGSEEEMLATAQGAELNVRAARPDVPRGLRQFQDASLGWRFWTLFAGPLMNFIFAIVVFIGIYSFVGVPVEDGGTATNRIDKVVADNPAAKAGLKSGDYVIGINNVKTTDTKTLTELIRASNGKPLTLLVQRGQQVLTKEVQPVMKDDMPRLDGMGTERRPAIGIVFYNDPNKVPKVHYRKIGVVNGVILGWQQAVDISSQIIHLVGRAATFRLSSEERKGVGGPVMIAQAAGQMAQQGWQASALFAAGLSINLGLINLLPLPALDGGRILFLGYELVVRRPFDPKKEGLVHMVGMVMLLAFMLFITVRDVLPWITARLGKVF